MEAYTGTGEPSVGFVTKFVIFLLIVVALVGWGMYLYHVHWKRVNCDESCPVTLQQCKEKYSCVEQHVPKWEKTGQGLTPIEGTTNYGNHQDISSDTDTIQKAEAWVRSRNGVLLLWPTHRDENGTPWYFFWRDTIPKDLGQSDNNGAWETYRWQ